MEVSIFGPIKTQHRNYWLVSIGNRMVDIFMRGSVACLEEDGITTECKDIDEAFTLALDTQDRTWYNPENAKEERKQQ